MNGTINWYDPHSRHGSIVGDDGSYYRIHEFTRTGTTLESGERVSFELALSSINPIVIIVSRTE